MFIVTGTKRSGTSMWMQILIAAGLPIIGEAFPMRWEHTIKAANPEGFYEGTCAGAGFAGQQHGYSWCLSRQTLAVW